MKHVLKLALIAMLVTSCSTCKEEDPPIFTISLSSSHIVVGQSITFSQSATDAVSAEWTLPGSSTATFTGNTVTTTYNQPGTYTATVTVRNKNNASVQSVTIYVESGTWSFLFPGAPSNNNQTVGDFCCTGQTWTISNSANVPIGYAYFYSWDGNAYNINNTSIFPNFEIGISGASDLDGVTPRVISKIFFADYDCVIGRAKTVRVGNLEYKVTILEIAYPYNTPYVDTHFYGESLKVRLDVRYVI